MLETLLSTIDGSLQSEGQHLLAFYCLLFERLVDDGDRLIECEVLAQVGQQRTLSYADVALDSDDQATAGVACRGGHDRCRWRRLRDLDRAQRHALAIGLTSTSR